MKPETTIDSSWTVNEVIGKYPETVTVFNKFGVDSCCGGHENLVVAAQETAIDPDALVAALLDATAQSKAAK